MPTDGQLGLALKERAIANHRSKWAGTLAALDAHLRTLALDSGFAVSADDAHAYLDTNGICVTGDRRWPRRVVEARPLEAESLRPFDASRVPSPRVEFLEADMRNPPRIIDQLRDEYGGGWFYERDGSWRGPTFTVRAYAVLAPRYDGDDDSFVTEYIRSDTQRRVNILPRHGRLL